MLGAEYARCTDDGRVTFQFKAPHARRVQADMATKYDMAKDGDGVWTVTTPPIVPGFHHYQLVVDGTTRVGGNRARVADVAALAQRLRAAAVQMRGAP